MSKTTKIPIPEGATEIEIDVQREEYKAVVHFNNEKDTRHFWLPNGDYDGYSHERDQNPTAITVTNGEENA